MAAPEEKSYRAFTCLGITLTKPYESLVYVWL